MRDLLLIIEAASKGCPPATHDIDLNLKNRQRAIEKYHYGPANPDHPGTYWQNAAERWKITEKIARTMRCSNCAAFDISDQMRSCMKSGIQGTEKSVDAMASIEKADLGYCNFHSFKCAGSRSCTSWITGGSIDNKDRTQ